MDLQNFFVNILYFLNTSAVPFMLALAFLFFIVNVVRYFIVQGGSSEGREKAGRLALWGILTFIIIISLWGIVNLLVSGLGFNRENAVIPDYIEQSGAGSRGGAGDSGGRSFDECSDTVFGFIWCEGGPEEYNF